MVELLKLFLYLLLFFLPLGVMVRIPVSTSLHLNTLDVVVFFLFFIFLFTLLIHKIPLRKLYVYKPLYFFMGFTFVSLILNIHLLAFPEFLISLLYVLRFVAYTHLLFIFQMLDKNFTRKYIFSLTVSGFIFVCIGLIQYLLFSDLSSFFQYGWDEHKYRLFSTFFDPNFAGAFIVLEILLLVGLFFSSQQHKIFLYILGVGIVISILALFLTYSRSSLFMFIVSIPILFFLLKKTKYLIFLCGIIIVLFVFIPKDFSIENMNPFRTASIEGRIHSIQNGLKVFQSSPVYGIGFNAYRYSQKRLGLLDSKWEVTHAGAGVSNSYVFVLATTGLIGFFLFIYFIYKILEITRPKTDKSGKGMHLGSVVTSSMVGVLVHSIFDNTFFYPFILAWLFLLLGALFKTETSISK